MMFAVSVCASRVRPGANPVDVAHTVMLLEAFNKDEAVGIGWRVADYSYPAGEGWTARTVGATSDQLDSSRPFDEQMEKAPSPGAYL